MVTVKSEPNTNNTFQEADEIKVESGILYVYTKLSLIAVFAPSKWSYVFVAKDSTA
jgi:hypothetical protein